MNKIYIPEKDKIAKDNMWRWYQNAILETNLLDLSDKEREVFCEYYREAGLFQTWRQPFFKQHYANTFERASVYLLESTSKPRIVDLGCGTGTQSLYFALMGASVAAFDMDSVALEIFRKRIDYYQKYSGRQLDITIYEANTLMFDYEQIGPIDGVYSMFAFNMMQPSDVLVENIDRSMHKGARVAIIDGNNLSWLPRVVPSRRRNVWSPKTFRNKLEEIGYKVDKHHGGIVFPPLMWRIIPRIFIEPMDQLLSKFWLFPISHQILAEKL
ncbi:MAG: methyltransferase domain-containing protein [Porticoccus sp.]|nr:methyltransferase domain-containing protein [Porticoccus sp.]